MSREVQAVCGVTDDVGEMAASFQEAAATCLYSQGVGMRRGAVRVRCSDGMAWWIRAMESCGLYVQRAGRDGTCCAKGRMLAWELEERQNDTAFIRPTTHHAATIMIPGAVCCTENMKQGCGVVSAIT